MSYRSINDIAADVRANLKAEFPEWKFSVRIEKYSGGQSLHVALVSGPESPFADSPVNVDHRGNPRMEAQLNEYHFRNNRSTGGTDGLGNRLPDFYNNGVVLTEDAWNMLTRVDQIANADNWDKSDIMTDYFNVNYYFHLSIGKWDKPFTVVTKK